MIEWGQQHISAKKIFNGDPSFDRKLDMVTAGAKPFVRASFDQDIKGELPNYR